MAQQAYCTAHGVISATLSGTRSQDIPHRCCVTSYKLLQRSGRLNRNKVIHEISHYCLPLSQIRYHITTKQHVGCQERHYMEWNPWHDPMCTAWYMLHIWCSLPLLQPQCRTDIKVHQQTASRQPHCSLGCLQSVVSLLHSNQHTGFVHLQHITNMGW